MGQTTGERNFEEVFPGMYRVIQGNGQGCTDEELDQILAECEQILAQAMTHAG